MPGYTPQMKNIPYTRVRSKIPSMRKIALSGWGDPSDPSIYTVLECPAQKLQAWLSEQNQNRTVKLTETHVVTAALGRTFAKYPQLNRVLIRKKFRQRTDISAFVIVTIRQLGGVDLSGVNISPVDQLSIAQIANELDQKSKALRNGQDRQIHRVQKTLSLVTSRAAFYLLRIVNVFLGSLNLNLTWLGLPRHRFGSFAVSSIGGLGVDNAHIPFFPPARCPFLVGVPRIQMKPVVEGDHVVARPILSLYITIDHRYVDGYIAAKALRYLKKCLQDPSRLNGLK